jgi:hypothetical protein
MIEMTREKELWCGPTPAAHLTRAFGVPLYRGFLHLLEVIG